MNSLSYTYFYRRLF